MFDRLAQNRCARLVLVVGVIIGLAVVAGIAQEEMPTIIYGTDDILTIPSLPIIVAAKHLEERGIAHIEFIVLKSDVVASQALLAGEVDVIAGTPFALVQQLKDEEAVRFFLVQKRVEWFPVVRTSMYKDWADLDGQPMAVHSRGSGTEAQAKVMAIINGIEYSEMSYVPGSEVRALAMLNGSLDVTFLDVFNSNWLFEQAPGEFAPLPYTGAPASSSILSARVDWIEANLDVVHELIREQIKVCRRMLADPTYMAEERAEHGLLTDLSPAAEVEFDSYWQTAAANHFFDPNGGLSDESMRIDITFFQISGQIEGDPSTIPFEDFFYYAPVRNVLSELGEVEITYHAPQ